MGRYTSTEKINYWLRGRLNVPASNYTSNPAIGEVDVAFVEHVIQQNEDLIDAGLRQIYQLPIPAEATEALSLIGAITEKLVVSEIYLVHFQATGVVSDTSDDNYGKNLRKQALDQLSMILLSHGIFLPGLTQEPTISNTANFQPILLKGVPLLPGDLQPDTIHRDNVYVANRSVEAIGF